MSPRFASDFTNLALGRYGPSSRKEMGMSEIIIVYGLTQRKPIKDD